MNRRGLGVGRQETLDMEQNQEEMICTKCGEHILGKAMKAGDTYWHESHFTCSECGVRLRDAKVFQKDGLLYCEMDYKKKFVPRTQSKPWVRLGTRNTSSASPAALS